MNSGEVVSDPELVFGIVGPIGINVDDIVKSLADELKLLGYQTVVIHLTNHLSAVQSLKLMVDDSSYYSRYKTLIDKGNEFREKSKSDAAFAGLAIARIRQERSSLSGDVNKPKQGAAYIIRQFKRSEEIEVMRRVYGKKFMLISAYGSKEDRLAIMEKKINSYNSSPKDQFGCARDALDLVATDHNQKDKKSGQRVGDIFHLGDVFVNGIDKAEMIKTMKRFIRGFFGCNDVTPSKDEYGMFMATAASLRSADLARQVGAAIFTSCGEIISAGSNEVPKAKGGTYWSDSPLGIHRDIEKKVDPNHEQRAEIVHDLINRMDQNNWLSSSLKQKIAQGDISEVLQDTAIKNSRAMDILEFGRIIHAEMSAITDAARLGRQTYNATLYSTAFPCHMCAKHIVAAGIMRVVFLEPYPKSYALKLHDDSITFDSKVEGMVLFQPFMGISPRIYREMFEKRSRKIDGKVQDWYRGKAIPMIEDTGAAYITNEEPEMLAALGELKPTPALPAKPSSAQE